MLQGKKKIRYYLSGYRMVMLIWLLLSSCIKEEFDNEKLNRSVEFESGIAWPVVYKTFTLRQYLVDSIGDSRLVSDEDGFLTLIYEKNILNLEASSAITFENMQNAAGIQNNTANPIPAGNINPAIEISDTIVLPLNLGGSSGDMIDSVFINSMDVSFNISNVQIDGILNINTPNIKVSGRNYSTTFNLSQQNIDEQIVNGQIYPEGSRLMIEVNLQVNQASQSIAQGAQLFTLEVRLQNIDYEIIFGEFGNNLIGNYQDSLYVTYSHNFSELPGFNFESPVMKILSHNSFGLPLCVGFKQFYTRSSVLGKMNFSGPGMPVNGNYWDIDFPQYSPILQSVDDSLLFDCTNSNLCEILNALPKYIYFDVDGTINPRGLGSKGFIHKNSRLQMDYSLELPLWGYANSISMQDTIPFILQDFTHTDFVNIEEVEFRFTVLNSLPVSIDLQIFFAEDDFDKPPSISESYINIPAGEDVNGDGRVDKPMEYIPEPLTYDKDDLQKIENATYLIYSGKMRTLNAPEPVKFYDGDKLYVAMGIIVHAKVSTQ